MDLAVLIGMAVVLILFVWGWIALVMFHHLSLDRRLEKLINITNPLPEEEKELVYLKEQRTIESSKVRSAKAVLFLFILLILGGIAAAAVSQSLKQIFGTDTLVRSIWVGVVVLSFFCLPTYLGLSLAGSRVKMPKQGKQPKSGESAA